MKTLQHLCLFFTVISITTFASDDYRQIVSSTGKCLDVNGGKSANLTPVVAWDCHGRTNQQWKMDHYGRIRPRHAPHMCHLITHNFGLAQSLPSVHIVY
ncbi:RICIN domain-containing protein [Spartinivicinus poritis]|uniref:RICIN domain-containing protein n=1 Tax=Spartinivicinus poritis TaxID=2994640 RepID=A0ABT5U909_9GAMM|nr:RICIN domain-containing protein [Spartinivicinus sp. A2-2]MDE1462862.1 RICIN domain-containing protein [Spartinivicinus sp. A2-2]